MERDFTDVVAIIYLTNVAISLTNKKNIWCIEENHTFVILLYIIIKIQVERPSDMMTVDAVGLIGRKISLSLDLC